MLKSVKRYLHQRRGRYRVPRRVQDLIPVGYIWEDGIFRTGNLYSKSFRFSDINYKVASDEDQRRMFMGYSSILNGLDSGGSAQILVDNKRSLMISDRNAPDASEAERPVPMGLIVRQE